MAASGPKATLATAIVQCERYWGATWYWNPARWGTTDGYAPWRVVWIYWMAMRSPAAMERLSALRVQTMGRLEGDAAAQAIESDVRDAFPEG